MAGTPDAVSPECRGGKVVIGYEGRPQTEKDWFGLYNQRPDVSNWRIGLVGHTSGDDQSGEWQWASKGASYTTGQVSGETLRTVYWTHDGSGYVAVSDTEATSLYCQL